MDNPNTEEFMNIMLQAAVQDKRISDIVRIASRDLVHASPDTEASDTFAELAVPVLRYYGISERKHIEAVYTLFQQKRIEKEQNG